MWYKIKVKQSMVEAPKHISTLLRLLIKQEDEIKEIATPYIKNEAYLAHSESLILFLIASSDKESRRLSIKTIKEIWNGLEYRDTQFRKKVKLNLVAMSIQELINWEKEDKPEPVFTCQIHTQDLDYFLELPFKASYFPLHTQPCEREGNTCICIVCRFEKRGGLVRARMVNRLIMSKLHSKKDIKNIF